MELRKDYILDRFVLISESRGVRPNEFLHRYEPTSMDTVCFFCPGNEHLTPPEIGHLGDPWKLRWFENKFPALVPQGKSRISTDNKYFTYSDAYGYNEVIVETSSHEKQLHDMSDFEVKDLLKIYKLRIEALSALDNIKYVLVFKNNGKDAGTSLKHSHTQVAAMNHVPKSVTEKLEAVHKYDSCPYCEVLNIEKSSARRCYENNSFVAFTPYASRYNYEICIFPKKHYSTITQLDDWEFLELAQILKKALLKLKDLGCSYNFFIHNTPQFLADKPKSLHFHIEICPRISIFGGFEMGSDIIINTVSPELAAKFYRGD